MLLPRKLEGASMRRPLSPAVLLAAAAVMLIAGPLGSRAEAPPSAAESSASYSLGLSFATQWREQGLGPGLSEDDLVRGIRDGLGGKPLTAEDRARAGDFLKKVHEALGERNKAAAQAFLEKNGREKGVTTTASGLQYVVLVAGDAAAPIAGANDRVTVHYRGTFLDGQEFDSSIARGKPAVIRPGTVIPGWREVLGLMHRGAKWRVFLPPELGYGSTPPPSIPANSALVFEIEVLGIEAAAPN
jgi:FKBP-type peptidyl-prolyl cis-trans isomerase FklB